MSYFNQQQDKEEKGKVNFGFVDDEKKDDKKVDDHSATEIRNEHDKFMSEMYERQDNINEKEEEKYQFKYKRFEDLHVKYI